MSAVSRKIFIGRLLAGASGGRRIADADSTPACPIVPPPADVSVTWAEPAIWSGWTVAEKVCSVLELGVGVADARAGTLQVRHAVLDRDRRDPPAVNPSGHRCRAGTGDSVGIGHRFQQATGTRGLRDLDHRLEHRVVPVTRALFQRQEPPF